MAKTDSLEKQQRWAKRFLDLCALLAAWSEDKDRGVGAVIVGPALEIRSTGLSGLPRGVRDDDLGRFDRPSGEKFLWVEHAERNAIYNAARIGVAIAGCTIYSNRFPCASCARAIIQSGITDVCCPPRPTDDGKLDYSFKVAETLLAEAGIKMRIVPVEAAPPPDDN